MIRRRVSKAFWPMVYLFVLASSLFCATLLPWVAKYVLPLGNIFFALVRMVALPIVITSVTLSFAHLFRTSHSLHCLKRLTAIFVVSALMSGFLGVVSGAVLSRQLLKDEGVSTWISNLLHATVPTDTGTTNKVTSQPGLMHFIENLVPANIFLALSQGEVIGILVSVMLLGLAVGSTKTNGSHAVLLTLEGVNGALFKIMNWVMKLLPLGLASLVFELADKFRGDSVASFSKCLTGFGLSLLFLLLLQLLWARALFREGIFSILNKLSRPLLTALCTSSSIATLPILSFSLQKQFRVNRWTSDLVLSLGLTFGKQGVVFFFAVLGTLLVRVYGLPIGPSQVLLIIVASQLQSLGTAGLPIMASLSMLASLYGPLGLPVETLTVLMATLLPVFDPLLTFLNTLGYAVLTALVERFAQVRVPVPMALPAAERAEIVVK